MRPTATLDEAQLALSRLLFQTSVPSGERSRRAFFIAAAVQRLYRAFDFDVTRRTVSITLDADGRANLSGAIVDGGLALNIGQFPAIDYIDDGNNPYNYSMIKDSPRYQTGDYQYWVTVSAAGDWILNTSEPNATINFSYFEAPNIADANLAALNAVPFTPMIIGKGALIYYRQAEDPEADTSVEEDQFRQEVAETIEAQNRRRPQQFAKTHRDRTGHYLGRTR